MFGIAHRRAIHRDGQYCLSTLRPKVFSRRRGCPVDVEIVASTPLDLKGIRQWLGILVILRLRGLAALKEDRLAALPSRIFHDIRLA